MHAKPRRNKGVSRGFEHDRLGEFTEGISIPLLSWQTSLNHYKCCKFCPQCHPKKKQEFNSNYLIPAELQYRSFLLQRKVLVQTQVAQRELYLLDISYFIMNGDVRLARQIKRIGELMVHQCSNPENTSRVKESLVMFILQRQLKAIEISRACARLQPAPQKTSTKGEKQHFPNNQKSSIQPTKKNCKKKL